MSSDCHEGGSNLHLLVFRALCLIAATLVQKSQTLEACVDDPTGGSVPQVSNIYHYLCTKVVSEAGEGVTGSCVFK